MKKPHPREVIGFKKKCEKTGKCEPVKSDRYWGTECKHCKRRMKSKREDG